MENCGHEFFQKNGKSSSLKRSTSNVSISAFEHPTDSQTKMKQMSGDILTVKEIVYSICFNPVPSVVRSITVGRSKISQQSFGWTE